MSFKDFLIQKRNFIILWITFHLFALVVNLYEIRGNIVEQNDTKQGFAMEKNLFMTPRIAQEYNKTYFWPFVKFGSNRIYVGEGYYDTERTSYWFYGLFMWYDWLEFWVYIFLLFLGLYFYWDRKKSGTSKQVESKKWNPENPLWVHSIWHFKQLGYIKTGLTIPFLVGIYVDKYQLLPNVDTLKRVIKEIAFTKTSIRPVLMFCDEINEYVINVYSQEYCNERSFNSLLNTDDENIKINLLVADNSKHFGLDINTLCDSLYKRYEQNIQSQLFSWSGATYQWREFNEYEKKQITEIK